ncbi:MAG: hypothetical protein F6K40_10910 [Okeania sp. SIO3I5]|uniref:hypothetical protein n=1 Tax=Okeania sp. SIO3I5 TaxID=2607805 RepID=UPI0013B8D3F6|nr:hypothetical protein [Okeania sp. SIO3I5]NEQ36760.1 hypothetical protein [Okeania sp. SIO3I5]
MSKNSLSEDEFKRLVERLSHRRNELEGRITIDSVRQSLLELGLSDLLRENDIEEVSKQVSREFQRRQWKNYFGFALILIILVAPLAAFGGYKLREYIVANVPQLVGLDETPDPSKLLELEAQVEKLTANQTALENQLENSQTEKDELKDRIQELEVENKDLKNRTNTPISTTVTTPSIETTETISTPIASFAVQGLVYDLKSCQKSNVNPKSQTISCVLLITSKQENVSFSLYSNRSGRRSRIFEAGKEYLATRVKLGTYSGTSRVRNNLITDVPIEATITFDNVPLEVNKIQVFQISSWLQSSYYNNGINVEFRNLSLSEN